MPATEHCAADLHEIGDGVVAIADELVLSVSECCSGSPPESSSEED